MSATDDLTRLRHIRDAARKAIDFTKGQTRESLADDDMLQLALVRLVEIIGEAAARLARMSRQDTVKSRGPLSLGCGTDWYTGISRLT